MKANLLSILLALLISFFASLTAIYTYHAGFLPGTTGQKKG